MNVRRQPTLQSITDQKLNDLIVDAMSDIKGKRIVKLDLREINDAPADYFIICEGDSNIQVKALADNVYRHVKRESGLTPSHIEGTQQAKWILVDYFSTVVHIFYPETRAFYDLEDLWSDAQIVVFESL